jgi:hypothetical protein
VLGLPPAALAEAFTAAGLSWRPGTGFHIGSDVAVNYVLNAVKPA